MYILNKVKAAMVVVMVAVIVPLVTAAFLIVSFLTVVRTNSSGFIKNNYSRIK